MDKYKFSKVKKILRYVYDFSPFYHKLLKENGLRPSDIRSYSDLVKIPYTLPSDLEKKPTAFFAVPKERFSKVLTTAGTTGHPKKAYFTKKDMEVIIRLVATGGRLLYNISKTDVIRFSYEVGYGTEIWGTRYCFDCAYGKRIGAMMITAGQLSPEEELEIIHEYKPNIFGDVTSRVNYLTKEMSKICSLDTLGIEKMLIGAEPTSDVVRKNIENVWGADAFIGYGINEVGPLMAGECKYKQGMHLSETSYFLEVVDPKTGEQLEDGEVGEFIYTTLDREGMPLVRYNSHDLGRIIPDICHCGLPLKRIEIKGRTDDMVPIGAGDNLYTNIFDEIIYTIPEVIEYRVVFDRKHDKDVIMVIAESRVRNNTLERKIKDAVLSISKIRDGIERSKTISSPKVKLVKPNTFDRKSIKMRRLVDNRNRYD